MASEYRAAWVAASQAAAYSQVVAAAGNSVAGHYAVGVAATWAAAVLQVVVAAGTPWVGARVAVGGAAGYHTAAVAETVVVAATQAT